MKEIIGRSPGLQVCAIPVARKPGYTGTLTAVFEELGPHAERTGAVLLTAFGYDYVPGNLAGALALEAAGPAATQVRVGYFVSGNIRRAASAGTRASSEPAPWRAPAPPRDCIARPRPRRSHPPRPAATEQRFRPSGELQAADAPGPLGAVCGRNKQYGSFG
jgi:hypothetical protein